MLDNVELKKTFTKSTNFFKKLSYWWQSALSKEKTINAVDVARKSILNVYLQTAIYV